MQPVTVTSPPVMAAATAKVPASSRSGITRCREGTRSVVPSIWMMGVPAPVIAGAHRYEMLGQVGDLGFAGGVDDAGLAFGEDSGEHQILGCPHRREGQARPRPRPDRPRTWASRTPCTSRKDAPICLKALDVHVDGPGPEVVAPGERNPGFAAARQEGPEDDDRGPHPTDQFERGFRDQLIGGHQPEGTVLATNVASKMGEYVTHQCHVVDLGDVGELVSPGSEDGGDHLFEGGVLGATHSNGAAERVPALYGHFGHRSILRRERANLGGVPFDVHMRVAVAADHAGFELKEHLAKFLADEGHAVFDLGTHNTDPVDYPDTALAAARSILDGKAARAVLICGSGAGACVAANKVRGIRAAIAHDAYTAHQMVEHDDVNILCLGLPGHRTGAGRRPDPDLPRRRVHRRRPPPTPPAKDRRPRGGNTRNLRL